MDRGQVGLRSPLEDALGEHHEEVGLEPAPLDGADAPHPGPHGQPLDVPVDLVAQVKLHVAGKPLLDRDRHRARRRAPPRPVNAPSTTFSVGDSAPRNVERYSRRSAHAATWAAFSLRSFSTVTPRTEVIFIVTIGRALRRPASPRRPRPASSGSIWSSWMSKKIRFGLPRASAPPISCRSVVLARKSVRTRKVPSPSETRRSTVRLLGRWRFANPWRTT